MPISACTEISPLLPTLTRLDGRRKTRFRSTRHSWANRGRLVSLAVCLCVCVYLSIRPCLLFTLSFGESVECFHRVRSDALTLRHAHGPG